MTIKFCTYSVRKDLLPGSLIEYELDEQKLIGLIVKVNPILNSAVLIHWFTDVPIYLTEIGPYFWPGESIYSRLKVISK